MKAVYVTDVRKTEIREIERPTLSRGEVLIKVEAAGICGSDLHVYLGLHAFRKPPVILGHEFSGVICEVGEGVTRFAVGDRVTVNPSISCGVCPSCKRGLENICNHRKAPGVGSWVGAFSEYFPAPEEIVYKIDDQVSFERAALTEPLSVAEHILRRSTLKEKKTMAILGCGTIGLMTLYLAKKSGIEKIICSDPAEKNREQALEIGADVVVDPLAEDPIEAAMKLTNQEGVDLCIVAAGAPNILDQASQMTRKGGEIGLVAMITKPLSFYCYSVVFREQTLYGNQVYQTEDFVKALEIINREKDVEQFITQQMKMQEIDKAMNMMMDKRERVTKIILKW